MSTSNITTSNSNSTGYEFRTTTKRNRDETEKKDPHYPNRTVLSPSKSASCKRVESHDCTTQEDTFITTKVIARLFYSLFRFSLAHSFNCETRRGQTHLNGSKSSCGGCQSAHAALSPTLYDNILDTITEKLGKLKFTELEFQEQCYLRARFDLTSDEITDLSSENREIRSNRLSEISSRLTLAEKKGTFVNSPTESARNATYENSTSSNRFDCYLEHHLRPLEDQLSNEKKEPIEALKTLQDEYRKLTETAITNLKEHFEKLDKLPVAAKRILWSMGLQ